jgi:5-methylcytosine-specific restriction endonuclease McrA
LLCYQPRLRRTNCLLKHDIIIRFVCQECGRPFTPNAFMRLA